MPIQINSSSGSITVNAEDGSGNINLTLPRAGLGTVATKNTGTGSGNIPILDGSGKLANSVIGAIALTTVQTAANEAAQLALTTQEGDVVIRSDENKSYVKNSGSAGTIADFTLLATPTDLVLSVNGSTGAVTIPEGNSGLVPSAGTSGQFLQYNGSWGSPTDATKLPLAGGTMTGSFTLNDNVKIQLGTGDDLQIYHDGSHSWIQDNGTGNLIIDTTNGTEVNINSGGNAEFMGRFIKDGAVKLYHNGSEKIETTSAGIDVTGTVTSSTGKFRYDDGDYIYLDNSVIDFHCNSAHRARIANNGDFHADGDIIAYSTTIPSDERLKTGITTVTNALDKIKDIRGVEFTIKSSGQRSAGVIAQEVEKVLPQAVKEKALPLQTGDETTKYKTVQYDALHALLIEAIKELSDKIEILEKK